MGRLPRPVVEGLKVYAQEGVEMEASAVAELVQVSTVDGQVPRWVCHECGCVTKDPMPERCPGCLRKLMAMPNGKSILHLTQEVPPAFSELAKASPEQKKKMVAAVEKLGYERYALYPHWYHFVAVFIAAALGAAAGVAAVLWLVGFLQQY